MASGLGQELDKVQLELLSNAEQVGRELYARSEAPAALQRRAQLAEEANGAAQARTTPSRSSRRRRLTKRRRRDRVGSGRVAAPPLRHSW